MTPHAQALRPPRVVSSIAAHPTDCWGGAAFGPPLETPTIAGRMHPVRDDVARLHDLNHAAGRYIGVRHFEHRLMEIGIEFRTQRIDPLDAVLVQAP